MEFKDILRSLRKQHHLTQEEFSAVLKITPMALSHYERGTRYPRKDTLEAIADYFNVDMNYLTGRSNQTTLIVPAGAQECTMEEQEILELFRNADDIGRAGAISLLKSRQIVKKEQAIS